MWSKTIILVLAVFLAMGIGLPAFASEGPNLYDPGDVDPWGGDNYSDDGDGDTHIGDGVIINPVINNMPTSFIRIAVERTWLKITRDLRKSVWVEDEQELIESRLETTTSKLTPINTKSGTGIR